MKLLFALLIAFLSSTAVAQPYLDGYIIKPNGDTLKGLIRYPDYNRWQKCPTSIKFKSDRKARALNFTAGAIREFHVNDHETYITFAGLVSADGNSYPITGFKLDTSKKQDTIFLKQIAKGKHLTLYYHNDRYKTRYFISENNGTPVELEFHLYFENPNKLVQRPMYHGWLMSLANKYEPENVALIKKIPEIQFAETDFEDFVNEINNAN